MTWPGIFFACLSLFLVVLPSVRFRPAIMYTFLPEKTRIPFLFVSNDFADFSGILIFVLKNNRVKSRINFPDLRFYSFSTFDCEAEDVLYLFFWNLTVRVYYL